MVRPTSDGMPRDSMVLFCSAVSAIRAMIAKISASVVFSVMVSYIGQGIKKEEGQTKSR